MLLLGSNKGKSMDTYKVNWTKPLNLVIMAPPGGGKDSLIQLILADLEKQGFERPLHISTSDLLIKEIKKNTEHGKKLAEIMDRGDLIDDETIIPIFENYLKSSDLSKGFFLNGYPRNLKQSKHLSRFLESLGKPLDFVLYVEVPDDEIVNRLMFRLTCKECGMVYHEIRRPPKKVRTCDNCDSKLYTRPEDEKKAILKRTKLAREFFTSVKNYFMNKEKIALINGAGDLEKVFGRACYVIDGYQKYGYV